MSSALQSGRVKTSPVTSVLLAVEWENKYLVLFTGEFISIENYEITKQSQAISNYVFKHHSLKVQIETFLK